MTTEIDPTKATDDAQPSEFHSAGPTEIFAEGGEMGALVRAMDWSQTPLGPVEKWSASLRMMVAFLLANRFPLLLWWGPDYISIYNDAYIPVLGAKHPWALGKPVRECWSEVWDFLQPLIDAPFQGGPATWMEDMSLELNRHGFVEEAHFTVAYSPVPDETEASGIGGVLATVHEITDKIVGERRTAALRDLAASATDSKTAEEACVRSAEGLAGHAKDVPFILLYLVDAESRQARLVGKNGIAAGDVAAPDFISLDSAAPDHAIWPLVEVRKSGAAVTVEDLGARIADVPAGPWSHPPRTAVIMPIKSHMAHQLAGFMVVGASSRLRLDDRYLSFFELAAAQVATAVAGAQAYEQERRLNERLEARVAEEVEARESAQARLAQAQRMEALGHLAGGIAHDFNNVLQAVQGGLNLIDRRADDAESVRQLARMALGASSRGAAITGRLLSFARRAELQPTAVQPGPLLEGLREILVPTLGVAIEIELQIDGDAPSMRVDKAQLETVLINLAVNARDAMPAGGKLTILAIAETVPGYGADSSGLPAGGYTRLDFTDTGSGMDAATLKRALEPFFTTKPTGQGTGLGLSMARGLAEQSGGAFSLWSEPGRGTRASLWFPQAAEAGEPEIAPSTERPTATGAHLRALVVDDDPIFREILTQQVAAMGFEATPATDGLDALSKLDAGMVVDVLVTDYSMPGMNGEVLIKEVRKRHPNLPAVLLTGFADGDLRRQFDEHKEPQLTAFLRKPVDEKRLAHQIAAVIASSK